jgi:hypothetical protein
VRTGKWLAHEPENLLFLPSASQTKGLRDDVNLGIMVGYRFSPPSDPAQM